MLFAATTCWLLVSRINQINTRNYQQTTVSNINVTITYTQTTKGLVNCDNNPPACKWSGLILKGKYKKVNKKEKISKKKSKLQETEGSQPVMRKQSILQLLIITAASSSSSSRCPATLSSGVSHFECVCVCPCFKRKTT